MKWRLHSIEVLRPRVYAMKLFVGEDTHVTSYEFRADAHPVVEVISAEASFYDLVGRQQSVADPLFDAVRAFHRACLKEES